MNKPVLFFLLFFAIPLKASLFSDLNRVFENADVPDAEEARGYWAGYCAHENLPFQAYPAVYVYKKTLNKNFLPYPYDSQTYFVNETEAENYYHDFSPEEIEHDPRLREWFNEEEPWAPVSFLHSSFANHIGSPEFGTTRLVRLHYVNGKANYVLKVVPYDSPFEFPYTLCYFPAYLGDLPFIPPTPPPMPMPPPPVPMPPPPVPMPPPPMPMPPPPVPMPPPPVPMPPPPVPMPPPPVPMPPPPVPMPPPPVPMPPPPVPMPPPPVPMPPPPVPMPPPPMPMPPPPVPMPPPPVPMPPPPIPAPPVVFPAKAFSLGQTGPIENKNKIVLQLEAARTANTLYFVHRGSAPVTLENVALTVPGAILTVEEEELVLNPNTLMEVPLGTPQEEIISLTFDLKGKTDNIEVRASLNNRGDN